MLIASSKGDFYAGCHRITIPNFQKRYTTLFVNKVVFGNEISENNFNY